MYDVPLIFESKNIATVCVEPNGVEKCISAYNPTGELVKGYTDLYHVYHTWANSKYDLKAVDRVNVKFSLRLLLDDVEKRYLQDILYMQWLCNHSDGYAHTPHGNYINLGTITKFQDLIDIGLHLGLDGASQNVSVKATHHFGDTTVNALLTAVNGKLTPHHVSSGYYHLVMDTARDYPINRANDILRPSKTGPDKFVGKQIRVVPLEFETPIGINTTLAIVMYT